MELFKLNQGPWTLLFEGEFQQMPLSIYINPDKIILVLIFDMGKNKPKGAVTQVHYPFVAQGNLENILEGLPHTVSVLARHEPNETSKFLLVGSSPNYLDWKEEKFQKGFAKMLKEVQITAKTVEDFAKGFEIKMKSVAEVGGEVENTFFMEPVLIPALAAKMPKEKIKAKAEEIVASGNLPFGLDKANNLVEEPFSLFKTTLVSDGTQENRNHTMQVLAENTLLAGAALTLFEWAEEFDGLSQPTDKTKELAKEKISFEPVGFPVKHFHPKKDIFVDVNMINPVGLMQLFGVADEELIKFFQKKMTEKEFKSMNELIKSVKGSQPAAGMNQYQINKLVRILELMQSIYPELFDGQNPVEEIAKHWVKNIGRAGIIHLKDLDERASLMLLHTLIKGILIKQRESGQGKNLKAMVLLPQAEKVLGQKQEALLAQEIIDFLTELESYGVGFILESPHPIDIKKDLTEKVNTHLTMLRGLDTAVKIKGARGFRMKIRLALSRSALA
jgi:hypothetical protein